MRSRKHGTKSLPALTSLPRFLFDLSSPSTKVSTLAARIKKSSPTICPSLTLTSTCFLKRCWTLKANISLLAQKLLIWQEVIQAKESCSKLRKIFKNYFLPTYCPEDAPSLEASAGSLPSCYCRTQHYPRDARVPQDNAGRPGRQGQASQHSGNRQLPTD